MAAAVLLRMRRGGKQKSERGGEREAGAGGSLGPRASVEVARLREEAAEGLNPPRPHQRRVGPRVLRFLGEALRSNGRMHERLVGELGVVLTDLRMSPDLRTAFVQWSAFSGAEERAGRELSAAAGLLRRKLRRLGLKYTPQVVFRSGRLTLQQAQVEEAFARIRSMNEEDEQERSRIAGVRGEEDGRGGGGVPENNK